MKITKETIITRNQDALAARLDDEIVMMDNECGDYFNLNSTAAYIWAMLENGAMNLDELCTKLTKAYKVDYDTCVADTTLFIEDMVTKKVITLSN